MLSGIFGPEAEVFDLSLTFTSWFKDLEGVLKILRFYLNFTRQLDP